MASPYLYGGANGRTEEDSVMELNINKDEAQLIDCALTYYLKQGAARWCQDWFPKADLECVFNQLNIIEELEE